MDMHDIRITNLVKLESGFDRKKDFAEAVDVSPAYIRQLKDRHRVVSEKTARKIESKLGLPHAYMDRPQSTELSVNVLDQGNDVLIPLANDLNTGKEVMNGEYVKQSWLDETGYVADELLTIVNGNSNMSPEYEIGDSLIVLTSFDGESRQYENGKNYIFKNQTGEYIIYKVSVKMNGDLLLTSRDNTDRPDELVPSRDIISLNCIGTIVKMIRYF